MTNVILLIKCCFNSLFNRSLAKRKKCGQCDGCLAADCGKRFGGPRCKKKKVNKSTIKDDLQPILTYVSTPKAQLSTSTGITLATLDNQPPNQALPLSLSIHTGISTTSTQESETHLLWLELSLCSIIWVRWWPHCCAHCCYMVLKHQRMCL